MQVISLDLRPNGIFHYSQQADGGPAVYGRFVYREISAPEKLVFTTAFSNEQAQAVHAPISEDWPLEILNTLVLTESGGKTTLLLQGAPLTPTPAEAAMFASLAERIELGFASTLGQLDTHLKTMLKE